ncbi:MAG: hypothetical protein MJA28_00405 [Gammaproteobacteria bacterium]|nr:hypothetical protein [Gammaproteobacteria bacterium]
MDRAFASYVMGLSVETQEVNLLKLRETLTDWLTSNADGNPERSRAPCGTCRDLTGSTYGYCI